MKKTHIGTAIILIPVCLWALFWLLPNHTVPPSSENDMSPAFVPAIALGTMLLTGLAMLIDGIRASAAQTKKMDEEFGDEATGINAPVMRNALWLTLLSVLSWFLIKYVGFEPAMTVLLIATMLYVGVRKPLTVGFTAVLMPIALSMAAWYFFSTEMPGFWR